LMCDVYVWCCVLWPFFAKAKAKAFVKKELPKPPRKRNA
jgi:hypothetical protein